MKTRSYEGFGLTLLDSAVTNVSGKHGPTTRVGGRLVTSTGKKALITMPTTPTIYWLLTDVIGPVITGRSFNELEQVRADVTEECEKKMRAAGLGSDERGSESFDQATLRHVISMVESLFLIAESLEQAVPLYTLLGGNHEQGDVRAEFLAYAFYCLGTEDSVRRFPSLYKITGAPGSWERLRERRAMDGEGLVAQISAMLDEFGRTDGQTVVKLKGGVRPWREELKDLVEIINRLGDRMKFLTYDPNAALSLNQLSQMAPGLQELRRQGKFGYVEDMVPWADMPEGNRILGQTIDMFTNMSPHDVPTHQAAFDSGAIDGTLAGDFHYAGGPLQVGKIFELCRRLGKKFGGHSNYSPGDSVMLMAHIKAANPDMQPVDTHYPWVVGYRDYVQGVEFRDGHITVPNRPGLGITINAGRLAAARTRFKRFGYQYRMDAEWAALEHSRWTTAGQRRAKGENAWYEAGIPRTSFAS